MKVFLPSISNINFKGIAKPFIDNKGRKIIPIAAEPAQHEIDEAINRTKENTDSSSGCNSNVYMLNNYMVVKKYFPDSKAANPYNGREYRALDYLFEHLSPYDSHFQKGLYAVEDTNNNENYLVSTKIKGDSADTENILNKNNLNSLVCLITNLDSPIKKEDLTENNFPFEIPMHYDLCRGNIKLTESEAGIIDFEYMHLENLEELYNLNKTNNSWSKSSPHGSDIPGFISNLSSFEHRALISILKKSDDKKARSLFIEYLNSKSNYYSALAKKYHIENYRAGYINEPCKEIQKKCEIYSRVLKKAHNNPNENEDVIKSEAIKIQASRYLFNLYDLMEYNKINLLEIANFLNRSNIFFMENYIKASQDHDINKIHYYIDCIAIFNSRSETITKLIDSLSTVPNPDNYSQSEIDLYEQALKKHKKFKSIQTQELSRTLDEIVSK